MAKGSAFERKLCITLSKWWSEGSRDDLLWRTAGSGARATTRSKKGKATKNSDGDIGALDPLGQELLDIMTIEAKRGYSSETLHAVLDVPDKGAKQTYVRWIEQAEESRRGSGALYWTLITQRDRRQALITIPLTMAEKLADAMGHICLPMEYLETGILTTNPDGTKYMLDLTTYRLEDFLSTVTPTHMKQLRRRAK